MAPRAACSGVGVAEGVCARVQRCYGIHAAFAAADADDMADLCDEDFAVTDLSRACGADDGIDGAALVVIGDAYLAAHVLYLTQSHFRTAVGLDLFGADGVVEGADLCEPAARPGGRSGRRPEGPRGR